MALELPRKSLKVVGKPAVCDTSSLLSAMVSPLLYLSPKVFETNNVGTNFGQRQMQILRLWRRLTMQKGNPSLTCGGYTFSRT